MSLQNTKVSTYKLMWQYMNAKEPSVFVSDIEEGVRRVRDSNGKYAFLLESVYNDFFNNKKPCDTMMVGNVLNRNHYGIATQKHSPLRYVENQFMHEIVFLSFFFVLMGHSEYEYTVQSDNNNNNNDKS